MNKRQKKKLENRAGFFHYRDYKLRVKILYDIFGSVVNNDAPYAFKQYMFNCAKTILFTKDRVFDRKYRRYTMPELKNCVGYRFGRYDDIVNAADKNGYKPGELAEPLPRGPLDFGKSWSRELFRGMHSSVPKASSACEAMGMEAD
jgi:hypothetical protein